MRNPFADSLGQRADGGFLRESVGDVRKAIALWQSLLTAPDAKSVRRILGQLESVEPEYLTAVMTEIEEAE